MSKMNSVVHYEMPYENRERMAKFYQTAFDWQTRITGNAYPPEARSRNAAG